MKSALHLLSLGSVLFFASCAGGYKLGNTANRDDVYASSTPQVQTETTTPETYTPQESTNPNIGENSERANNYNESQQRTDEDGDTYVTNNYYDYDSDEDYYYSRRIRRFYEPYYGFGYYSNAYSDPYYWWGPSYYRPGFSFHINIGPSIIAPWYWHSHYPYYGYTSYYPWYSSYPYYGYYNPYSYGYGYNNGYWNGYYNGYNDGYWGNPYGYNSYNDYYGYGYGGNYGGGFGNTYYGHRNNGVVNTSNTSSLMNDGGRVDKPHSDNVTIDRSNITIEKSQPNAVTDQVVKPGVSKPNVSGSQDRFDNNSNKGQVNNPNVQSGKVSPSQEPVNSERSQNFDTNPTVQKPHPGSTSIDVNPKTQVKPIPETTKPNTNVPQQKPQTEYQWDHPSQNQQAPKQQERQNDYQQVQRSNDNEYQVPRQNSYEQPRQQQDDEYVMPRQNEQPAYEAPRNYEAPQQQRGWNQNSNDNSPRVTPQPQVPQQQQRTYEAPREQPRVDVPRQQNNDRPTYNNNPAPRSSDGGGKRQESNAPRGRRP